MSPFWASLFDALRGRGRNATLFIVAVVVLIGFLLVAARLSREAYVNYVFPTLCWASLLVAAALVRDFFRARARRRERLGRTELSRDELNKARSKLVKGRNRKLL